MDLALLASFLARSILVVLGIIAVSVVFFFVFAAPKQYNPYRPDLVKIDGDNAVPADKDPGSSYGRFGIDERAKTLTAELTVQVVVLGDIGRSPRMQYHAISIAKHGGRVVLVGFVDSPLHPELANNPAIQVVPLSPPPSILQTRSKAAFALVGPLKVVWQAANLFRTLAYKVPASKFMLVQNPPAIPVLLIAQVVCLMRNTRFVIDWHNFGWSVLALKLGASHPLVLFSRLYEHVFSSLADRHFTVTTAMKKRLAGNSVTSNIVVLHDRPKDSFKVLTSQERREFLGRLPQTAQYAREIEKGEWRLVVSSTSWTADEDFSILLKALKAYSARIEGGEKLPKILAIITGKGPLKEYYLEQIKMLNQKKQLAHVLISSAWLSSEEYAMLLGAADLGVSLHKSTSGVDLPMKVVDMFGAGLPVAGWSKFEAWGELVHEGVNGRGFGGEQELQALLAELFSPSQAGRGLARLREGAVKEGGRRWEQEWDSLAGPVFGVSSNRA